MIKTKLTTLFLLASLTCISQKAKKSLITTTLFEDEFTIFTKNRIQSYSKQILQDSNRSELFFRKGLIEMLIFDTLSAIPDLNKAVELDTNNTIGYLLRGHINYIKNNFKDCINDYNRVLRSESLDNLFFKFQVLVNDELNDSTNGNIFSDSINNSLVYRLNIYYMRGTAKYKLGDYSGAIADYDNELIINKNDFDSYYWRGAAKYSLMDYAGAIVDYTHAIEIKPKDANAVWDRGVAKLVIKDLRGALLDFTKVIELNPYNTDAYDNRGSIKHSLNDYKGALADYNRSLSINPKNSIAYYNRGLVKIVLGQKNAGCLDLSKAGELGNSDAYQAIEKNCN